MTFILMIIVGALLILGLGILILKMIRRSRDVVPDVADRQTASGDRVVAIDDQGQPVMASAEGEEEPRDVAAFEDLLKDQLDDQRH
jgi:hypothetical protein